MSALAAPVMFDLFEATSPEALARARAAERDRRDAAFRARFQHGVWVAPWDCGDGTPKGAEKPGWTCPDCGTVEPSEFVLTLNHGFASYHDGDDFGGWCARMRARRVEVDAENAATRARHTATKETP